MMEHILIACRSAYRHAHPMAPKACSGLWFTYSKMTILQVSTAAYVYSITTPFIRVSARSFSACSPRLQPQLSASLLRQLTYSTTRFGIYSELKEVFTTARSSPSLPSLIAMASTSGFLGGVAGNPADVLNVRMQHDASLPPEKRRNYKNAIDGLVRVTKEEGWRTLFRGVGANSMRAVLMTASQLASYDGFKRVLLDKTALEDNLTTHFSASFMAGFVATTVCSPVDVIKTRVMSAHTTEGLLALLRRTVANEGIGWMFKGWVPSFVRLGPHTIATFLFLEQHKTLYRRWKDLEG